MKKIKFTVYTGFINCEHEVIEEFEDNVTEEELKEYAENFVWENISVNYREYNEEEDED